MTIALCASVIGVATVISLYRLSGEVETGQVTSERFIAALGVGVLSLVIVVVNLDRLRAPDDERPGSAMPSVGARSETDIEARGSKGSAQQPGQGRSQNDENGTTEGTASGPRMPAEFAKQVDRLLVEADKEAKAGNADAAEPLLVQAIEIIDTHAPDDLNERGQIVGALARLRFDVKRSGEGVDAIDQHIAKLLRYSKGDPMAVASFQELAGTLLGKDERYAESLERFRRVYDIQMRGNTSPSTLAETHANLAVSHARLDDKSAAKQELDRARELLRSAPPESVGVLRRLDRIAKEFEL